MYTSKSGKLLISEYNNISNIIVNGQTVDLEGPVSTPDVNLYYYLIKCGFVERVLYEDAGRDYKNPTLSCPGITFGSPAIYTGIVDYQVISGTGLSTSAGIFLSPPYGVGDFVLAKQSIDIDTSGNIISVYSSCKNVIGFGYTYDPSGVNPVISIGCGDIKSPPQVIPTIVGGAITAVNIPQPYFNNCGASYPDTVDVGVSDVTGSGAIIKVNTAGGALTNFTIIDGGQNYTNPFFTLSPSGCNANVFPIISTYPGKVAIISGSYFYNRPNISITDDFGNGAIPFAIMAGILDSDIITYSGVTIPRETTVTPTMKAGFNLGEQPSYPANPNFTAKNRYHQGADWTANGGGTVTLSGDGTPISWTDPHITNLNRWLLGTKLSNTVDSFETPSPIGIYTLKYIDNYVNTTTGTYLAINANNHKVINLSGPNTGTTSGIQLNVADIFYQYGGSLTGLTLNNTNLGSGYTGAITECSDGIFIYPIVENGFITEFNIICSGNSITSTPTINIYGTSVVGNVVTEQVSTSYDNPSNWEVALALNLAQSQGIFLIPQIYVSDPDPYTLGPTEIDLNQPLATQDGVIKSITSPNGQVPDTLRFMDLTQSYHGDSNFSVSGDLPDPLRTNWYNSGQNRHTFYQARFVNTDPTDTGYSWFTNKVYGDLPWMTGGPDSFGKYLTLSSDDDGFFTGNYLAGQNVVAEFIGTEHTFKSGQNINLFAFIGTDTLPISDGTNYSPNPFPVNGYVWVTGPSSIIVSFDTFQGTSTNNLKTINSHDIIDVTGGWLAYTIIGSNYGVPYEYSMQLCKDLGKTANHLNIPLSANASLIDQLVTIADTYLGPDNEIYLEYGNELWNQSFNAHNYLPCIGTLYEYLGIPWVNYFGGSTLLSSYFFQLFASGWVAAGRDINSLHFVYGSAQGSPDMTSQIIATCQQYNLPIHHIAIAPYADFNSDVDSSALIPYYTPIGANGSGWPPGAINDIYRTWFLNTNYYTGGFALHKSPIDSMGQPSQQLYIGNIINNGGNLTPGPYQIGLTFEDASGLETTFGNSLSVVGDINSFYQLLVDLPALPWWAEKVNVYIDIESSFVEPTPVWVKQMILYTGINRNDYPPNNTLVIQTYTPPTTGFIYPPSINYASGYISSKPTMITYEGGMINILSNNTPFKQYITHDCQADPSAADRTFDWYVGCQNGGCVVANYYQCFNSQDTLNIFALTFGTNQKVGSGRNNQYSVEDGRDHNGGPTPNESTMLFGFQKFIDRSPLIEHHPHVRPWHVFRENFHRVW